jgi:hypothetical protein
MKVEIKRILVIQVSKRLITRIQQLTKLPERTFLSSENLLAPPFTEHLCQSKKLHCLFTNNL